MTPSRETLCPKCGWPVVGLASYCARCGTRIFRDSKGSETADPYLGETIDGIFEVESSLGTGSMGIVYKARHRALKCYVALKVLRHDFLQDRVVQTRFQREAQAASSLSHPNVIHIMHYGKTALGAPYIAMECLDGDELAVLIPRQFPLDQRRVCNIALQTARALSAAHAANIIHRDLKPANIVVIRQNGIETVKVLDFGIAKIADVEGEGLTREGATCGTPAFMSPEQVLCQKVTPASDLFSLGSVMYYMLTCKLPFQGTSMVDMAHSILNTRPPAPGNRLDIAVDPGLERICLKALEKSPENRYRTADEMCRDLEDALVRMESEGVPAAKPKVVVGGDPSVDMSEKTSCMIDAMDDDEQGTVVEMQAMGGSLDMVNDDMLSTARENAVTKTVSAVTEALSGVFSRAGEDRAFAPEGRITARDAMRGRVPVGHGEPIEETLVRRKRLLRAFVIIGAAVCVCAILVLVLISKLTSPETLDDGDGTAIQAGSDAENPDGDAGKKDEPKLSRDELEYLTGIFADKSVHGTVIAAAHGMTGGLETEGEPAGDANKGGDSGKTAAAPVKAGPKQPKRTPKAVDKTPKAVDKKGDAASKKKAAAPKTQPKKTSAGSSAKTSGAASSKLAQAQKLEATDKKKACAVYKQLLQDPSLSQSDKLKVQSKVRSCGRISI